MADLTLDQTDAALAQGVTALTPTAAQMHIEHWRAACAEAGYGSVALGLADLAALLRADRLDGRAIGARLAELGTETAALADGHPAGDALARLGAGLQRAARALGA